MFLSERLAYTTSLVILAVNLIYLRSYLGKSTIFDVQKNGNESQKLRDEFFTEESMPSITTMPIDIATVGVQPKHSITILCGDGRRTGNLLFTLSSLLGIAHSNDMNPVLPIGLDLQTGFMLNIRLVNASIFEGDDYQLLYEVGAGKYDRNLEKAVSTGSKSTNFKLLGFYQSWKYFRSCETLIRQNLRFRDPIVRGGLSAIQTFLPDAKMNNDGYIYKIEVEGITVVGIHARRGDLLLSDKVEFGYTVPEKPFFRNAISHFVNSYPKVHFLVVSDDITWCRESLADIHPQMSFIEIPDPHINLAVLAMCNHVIMTTGTFGWWGAWLANGTTIYYKNWPRNNSVLAGIIKSEDFFPPNWIGML